MKVKDLRKSLNNSVEPVYFVVGDDSYLKEFVLNTFSSLLNKDVIDFNLNIFADFSAMGDIISSLKGYPLMDERKVVVVKQSCALTAEQDKLLVDYFKKPELQSIFVIFDDGDMKKYQKYGETIDCNSLSLEECTNQITLTVKHMNRSINYDAAQKLAEYCLCDLQKIHIELDKLVTYNIDSTITKQNVEAVVTPSTDYKVYELTQSLADKDPLKAKKIMENLLQLGNNSLSLIQSILSQYKRMLYSLISTGTEEEIAKSLNIKPFAVKMSRRTAEHYSPKILKAYCERLVELEYKCLTGQINKDDALKSAISMLIIK